MTDIIKQSINNEQKTESNNSMNETVISKWNTIDFIDYLDVTNNEVKNLPEEISISTMCTSCKLNTKLNIINIEKYLHLNSDDILSVKVNLASLSIDDFKNSLMYCLICCSLFVIVFVILFGIY